MCVNLVNWINYNINISFLFCDDFALSLLFCDAFGILLIFLLVFLLLLIPN